MPAVYASSSGASSMSVPSTGSGGQLRPLRADLGQPLVPRLQDHLVERVEHVAERRRLDGRPRPAPSPSPTAGPRTPAPPARTPPGRGRPSAARAGGSPPPVRARPSSAGRPARRATAAAPCAVRPTARSSGPRSASPTRPTGSPIVLANCVPRTSGESVSSRRHRGAELADRSGRVEPPRLRLQLPQVGVHLLEPAELLRGSARSGVSSRSSGTVSGSPSWSLKLSSESRYPRMPPPPPPPAAAAAWPSSCAAAVRAGPPPPARPAGRTAARPRGTPGRAAAAPPAPRRSSAGWR